MKKIDIEKEFIFSPSDFMASCIKARGKILIFSALFTLSLFGWKATRPILYKAAGVFQSGVDSTKSVSTLLTKALGENNPLSSVPEKDPKGILQSQSLLEEVVKKLNLQAEIRSKKRDGIWGRIKNNFLAEYAYFFYGKRKRPKSTFLTRKIVLAEEELLSEPTPFVCKDVFYDKEVYTILKLSYNPALGFTIFNNKGKYLGTCRPGVPFCREGLQFTLVPKGGEDDFKSEKFVLTFYPLHEAALALKQRLVVKREKTNKALLQITFKGRDRFLSASIVNAVLEEYRLLLQKLHKKMTDEHLEYLAGRKKKTIEEFSTLVEEQKKELTLAIQEGGFASLAHEVEFTEQLQSKVKGKLIAIKTEIERLEGALRKQKNLPQAQSFEEILSDVKDRPVPPLSEGLNDELVKDLLAKSTQEMESLSLEIEHYKSLIDKIPHPSFEITHLASILKDPSLQSFYIKTHEQQLALLDAKNWSDKEKERIKKDLETTKTYLISHLKQLKKSSKAKRELLKIKIEDALLYLIHLLAKQYEQGISELQNLTQETLSYPERWAKEKLLTFHSELSQSLIATLCNVIETKNFSHYLKTYESYPLVLASPPHLPQKPFLVLSCSAAFLAALLFSGTILFFKNTADGPKATFANLKELGICCFLPQEREGMRELYLFLKQYPEAKKIGIVSRFKPSFLPALQNKLIDEGETFEWVHLEAGASKEKIEKALQALTSARYTFIQSSAHLGSYAFTHLESVVDLILFEAKDELLKPFMQCPFKKPWAICCTLAKRKSARVPREREVAVTKDKTVVNQG